MRLPRLRFAAALALSALAAPPAKADFLTSHIDTATPIFSISVPSRGVVGELAYVGPSDVSLDGGNPILGYCTDLFRTIQANDRYAAVEVSVLSLANGDLAAKILAVDAATGDGSAAQRAAVQLAIWNVVESGRAGFGAWVNPLDADPGLLDRSAHGIALYQDAAKTTLVLGLSSDSLIVDDPSGSGVLQRMASLIGSALALRDAPPVVYYQPTTEYGQGFIGIRAVPEPSSLALAVVGFAAIGGAWMRHRLPRR